MHGAKTSVPEQDIFIALTLNDKTEHNVLHKQIEEWEELYPAVDVRQELRKMKGWIDANPTRRKTSRGIARFITGWLSRAQDSAGPVKGVIKTNDNPFLRDDI